MSAQSPVSQSHPLMVAWNAYSDGPEYVNAARWAVQPEHTKGSMWAAFAAGWSAVHNRAEPLTPAEPAEARIRSLEAALAAAQNADAEATAYLRARATAAEAKLGSLLARIHRDGGHRQAEVGTDQAYEEAVIIIARALQQEGE